MPRAIVPEESIVVTVSRKYEDCVQRAENLQWVVLELITI